MNSDQMILVEIGIGRQFAFKIIEKATQKMYRLEMWKKNQILIWPTNTQLNKNLN
jgi:hypothetical protein